MKIETKYSLGDFVYPINTRFESVKVPINCPVCNDKGKVELNDKSYTCPECRGYTYHTVDGDIKWYITDYKGHVGKINLGLYDNKYKHSNHDEIRYMLDSTGVDSGSLWDEENLFLTKEDAQLECDRRNKENLGNKK